MIELEKLRPEVREAVRELDGKAYPGSRTSEHWQTIRAELLRLANENADYGKHAIEQYKRGVYWMDRAKEAESELAAMKARIEGSHLVLADGHGGVMWPVGQSAFDHPKGQRFRLVVEE